jgi:hypothetical protein
MGGGAVVSALGYSQQIGASTAVHRQGTVTNQPDAVNNEKRLAEVTW